MNKKYYKVCCWAFGLLTLWSCRQQGPVVAEPSLIQLTGGVRSVVFGKGSVFTGDRFTASVCGWEGTSSTVDWTTAPTWTSSAEVEAGSSAVTIELTPPQEYQKSGLLTVVRAWYPAGELAGGRVSFSNPSGEVDVMLTGAVSGSLVNPIASPLLFNHLTTQLRFVLTGSWFSEEPVVSIAVKGVRLAMGLDLTTGELVAGAVQDLSVPGVAQGGVMPTKEGVVFGRSVMVLPIEGNRFLVDVQTALRSYPNIEVTTLDTQFTAGRCYTVTLRFSGDRTVTIQGSEVGDWSDGEYAEGALK